jgi:chemotaxis-related protein WspD
MSERADAALEAAPFHTDDCWNRIGVRGDESCPELAQYAHCRNCPVQAAVAADLLGSIPSGRYLAEWTEHVALPKRVDARTTQSAFIFRVAAEWLALPVTVVKEVADLKSVHSVPHRSGGVVLGLASIRGELMVSASLALILGLDPPSAAKGPASRTIYPRLLVIRRDDVRAACPVDEVHGVHRFPEATLAEVPATLARATAHYSKSLLPWNQHSVAVLDETLLFSALKRGLA